MKRKKTAEGVLENDLKYTITVAPDGSGVILVLEGEGFTKETIVSLPERKEISNDKDCQRSEKRRKVSNVDEADCSAKHLIKTTEQMRPVTINSLPLEILDNILSRLPFSSIRTALMVCKLWKQICDDENYWRRYFFREMGNPALLTAATWKQRVLYVMRIWLSSNYLISKSLDNLSIFMAINNLPMKGPSWGDNSSFVRISDIAHAAHVGSKEYIQSCLENERLEIVRTYWTDRGLLHAVLGGQIETARWLIEEKKANPLMKIEEDEEVDGGTRNLLYYAGYATSDQMCLLLLPYFSEDPQYISDRRGLLWKAVYNRWARVVKQLLSTELDLPRCHDGEGMTLLALAVICGDLEILGMILALPEIDPNEPSPDLEMDSERVWRPLHFAAKYASLDAIKMFFENSKFAQFIDINCRTEGVKSNKKTPLMLAVKRKSHDMIKYLIEKGADPDIPNSNGTTARMMHVKKGGEGKLE